MEKERVHFPDGFLDAFCKKNHIRKLSFFGSVLRSDFRADSDIDLLVEFERGNIPTLFDIVGLEMELSSFLGRKVDLRTPEDISRFSRERVMKESVPRYVAH
jgi:predicted nucleotidyltransferase